MSRAVRLKDFCSIVSINFALNLLSGPSLEGYASASALSISSSRRIAQASSSFEDLLTSSATAPSWSEVATATACRLFLKWM